MSSKIILKNLLVITPDGKIAYNEKFHSGVNVIRGDNGSGKSTICDFIYFVLGGDFNNWKKEAMQCKDVFAEVLLNDSLYTLRREISSSKQQSMYVYNGDLISAREDYYLGWQVFPYRQTEDKTSFSNLIFQILGFPEVKSGEMDTNLTLHQLLRLLYIDQESPTLSLFKFEPFFDNNLTRVAVEELLFGIYDDSLYNDRLEFKSINTTLSDQQKEIKSIQNTFKQVDRKYHFQDVKSEILEIYTEIKSIDENINLFYSDMKNTNDIVDEKQSRIFNLQETLTPVKNSIINNSNILERFKRDVFDSIEFIQELHNRALNIDQSLLTRNLLGKIPIKFCPNCFNEVNPIDTDHEHCYVCKKEISDEAEMINLRRMRQEMILQIEESTKIIKRKEEKIRELEVDLIQQLATARNLQAEIDLLSASSKPTRNEEMENLILKKGKLVATIEFLEKYSKMYDYFEELLKKNIELKSKAEELSQQIELKTEFQSKKRNLVLSKVKGFASEILKKDLPQEREFMNPINIGFSAALNNFSLNGRLNYSASSNVILKNAIRFAIFFASLEIQFMRFPKFILCDNIEDKGMQELRSHNFQKTIVDIALRMKGDFQIIFSTSMINPDLEDKGYSVGEFYTSANKSLNI